MTIFISLISGDLPLQKFKLKKLKLIQKWKLWRPVKKVEQNDNFEMEKLKYAILEKVKI